MGFNGISSASVLRIVRVEAGRSLRRLLEYSRTRDAAGLDWGGSAENRPESGYMLKEELIGCIDRLDVGEACESKKVPSLWFMSDGAPSRGP